MKASELKIGNYILINAYNEKNVISQVTEILDERIHLHNFWIGNTNTFAQRHPLEECFPIPLTEEWLLKFGGKEDERKDIYLPIPRVIDMRIYIKFDHLLLCKGQVCPMYEYEHIKNVHQLQNLYFALTGEELEIK
jgi:hypothetical protein